MNNVICFQEKRDDRDLARLMGDGQTHSPQDIALASGRGMQGAIDRGFASGKLLRTTWRESGEIRYINRQAALNNKPVNGQATASD